MNDPNSEDVDMHVVGDAEAHDILGRIEPFVDDHASQFLLAQMGSSGKSYRRESASAARRFVSEI